MCSETFNLGVTDERILFSINAWPGIVCDCLVGPQVLPHRITGNQYLDFLLHDLQTLVESVPLAVRARMWYLHDSAPAHFSRVVRDVLNTIYYDRSTGRGGPIAWPQRSTHSIPVGTHKFPVYAAPIYNEEALHHRIVDACQTIHN
jgi:hypothetical protein